MDRSFPKFIASLDVLDPQLKAKIGTRYESYLEALATDVMPQQAIPDIGTCVSPQVDNPYFDEKTSIKGKRKEIAEEAKHNRGGATNFPKPGRTTLGLPDNCTAIR